MCENSRRYVPRRFCEMTTHRPFRVLFVCTGNSARSILAEFILNARAHERFEAFSAGAKPTGIVNPRVIEILRDEFHMDPSRARSKSWLEFEGQHFDFIITLCDRAREECLDWPSHVATAHWSVPDPASKNESPEQGRHQVLETATLLATRIGLFTALPDKELVAMQLPQSHSGASTFPS